MEGWKERIVLDQARAEQEENGEIQRVLAVSGQDISL